MIDFASAALAFIAIVGTSVGLRVGYRRGAIARPTQPSDDCPHAWSNWVVSPEKDSQERKCEFCELVDRKMLPVVKPPVMCRPGDRHPWGPWGFEKIGIWDTNGKGKLYDQSTQVRVCTVCNLSDHQKLSL